MGYKFLSSLDECSRYHQIHVHPTDEEKTSFIIERRTYYYKVMLFDLKTIRVTYQRMVDKVLKHQLGRIMKGYVDDMLVKSMTFE